MNLGDFPALDRDPAAANLRRRVEADRAIIERLGRMCVTAPLQEGPWHLSAAEADRFCSHLEQQALQNGRRLDYAHAAEQIALPAREGHAAIVQQQMATEQSQFPSGPPALTWLRASAGLVARAAVAGCLSGVSVGLGVVHWCLGKRPLAWVAPNAVQQRVHVLKQKVEHLMAKALPPPSPKGFGLAHFLERAELERNLFLGESVFLHGHGPAQWWQVHAAAFEPSNHLTGNAPGQPSCESVSDRAFALWKTTALDPFRETANAVETRRKARNPQGLAHRLDVPEAASFWSSRIPNEVHCSFPRLETAVMLAVLSERCLARPSSQQPAPGQSGTPT